MILWSLPTSCMTGSVWVVVALTIIMATTVKSEWRPIRVIFLSLIVDLLGFTVILPLLPSMLEYYGATDQVSCNIGGVADFLSLSLL